MIIINNCEDSEVVDQNVKSCDDKEIGDAKEIDQSYLIIRKGTGQVRLPRSAVATFNDGKIYLRATEAEELSGMYPFLNSERVTWQSSGPAPRSIPTEANVP